MTHSLYPGTIWQLLLLRMLLLTIPSIQIPHRHTHPLTPISTSVAVQLTNIPPTQAIDAFTRVSSQARLLKQRLAETGFSGNPSSQCCGRLQVCSTVRAAGLTDVRAPAGAAFVFTPVRSFHLSRMLEKWKSSLKDSHLSASLPHFPSFLRFSHKYFSSIV